MLRLALVSYGDYFEYSSSPIFEFNIADYCLVTIEPNYNYNKCDASHIVGMRFKGIYKCKRPQSARRNEVLDKDYRVTYQELHFYIADQSSCYNFLRALYKFAEVSDIEIRRSAGGVASDALKT
jgi:hypothetical protein